MEIKTLYTFTVFTEKEVEKIEKISENGQEYEKKTKVKEKVPTRFALKKPSRKELEDARMHYGIAYNDMITKGFLTKGMLVNKYANNTGGVFSENEAKDLYSLYKKQDLLRNELQQAAAISTAKDIQDELTAKLAAVSRQMFEIENSNNSLFQHTAENKAQEKTIAYMIYFFTFIERNGKFTPYFEGEKFEQKEAFYFDLEEREDPVLVAARDRLLNLFTFYYLGLAEKEEDFKKVEDDLQKRFEEGGEARIG
jgi:hypothetical protein